MNRMKQSIKSLWRDLGTRRWIFLLALGFLIVVVAIPTGTGEETAEGTAGAAEQKADGQTSGAANSWEEVGSTLTFTEEEYEKRLEERLTAILTLIEGAGRVEVMVTVKSSAEKVLQTDTERQESIVNETDSSGGTRQNSEVNESFQTVTGSSSSGPYVIQEIMPQVEGVLVTCEGGDRASVQSEISAAVQALFGIEAHKIKVCKMAIQ